mmetsp:Transcript_74513/g.218434  ORF Transcript_74513/g.218434 Transcript_74513/m.218434 type:complete len:202 (-) Transcript_74513:576-1181(-)
MAGLSYSLGFLEALSPSAGRLEKTLKSQSQNSGAPSGDLARSPMERARACNASRLQQHWLAKALRKPCLEEKLCASALPQQNASARASKPPGAMFSAEQSSLKPWTPSRYCPKASSAAAAAWALSLPSAPRAAALDSSSSSKLAGRSEGARRSSGMFIMSLRSLVARLCKQPRFTRRRSRSSAFSKSLRPMPDVPCRTPRQ